MDHASDQMTLFQMPVALRELAAEAATVVQDQPATCQHGPAPLICGVHTEVGPMCFGCAESHLLGHGMFDDVTCTGCGALASDVQFGWLPAGPDFTVLVRLCDGCRTGRNSRSGR